MSCLSWKKHGPVAAAGVVRPLNFQMLRYQRGNVRSASTIFLSESLLNYHLEVNKVTKLHISTLLESDHSYPSHLPSCFLTLAVPHFWLHEDQKFAFLGHQHTSCSSDQPNIPSSCCDTFIGCISYFIRLLTPPPLSDYSSQLLLISFPLLKTSFFWQEMDFTSSELHELWWKKKAEPRFVSTGECWLLTSVLHQIVSSQRDRDKWMEHESISYIYFIKPCPFLGG